MTKTPHHHPRAWLIVLVLFWQVIVSLSIAADTSDRFVGKVLFMRHSLAPGFGDPDHFSVTDCSTQRNLDETGRCRCLETAQLLELGAVTPFDGLNSFFQNHAPRDATLAKLLEKLESLSPSAPASLMVTHAVTIRAITGLSVASGGVVIYDLKTGTAREMSLSSL